MPRTALEPAAPAADRLNGLLVAAERVIQVGKDEDLDEPELRFAVGARGCLPAEVRSLVVREGALEERKACLEVAELN